MPRGPKAADSAAIDRAIGARVRLRRLQRGLSHAELAAAAGMTVPALRRCEDGLSSIMSATLLHLAGPLQVSASWLLVGDGPQVSARRPLAQVPHAHGSEAAHADNPMLQACLVLAEEAFTGLPMPIYLTGSDGVVLFCNRAATQLVGRLPRIGHDKWCVSWRLYDLEGKRMAHEDCPMAVALQTGRPVRGAIAVLERPDGSRQCFMPFPTPLLNKQGELFGGFNALYPLKSSAASAATAGAA